MWAGLIIESTVNSAYFAIVLKKAFYFTDKGFGLIVDYFCPYGSVVTLKWLFVTLYLLGVLLTELEADNAPLDPLDAIDFCLPYYLNFEG